MFTYLYFIFSGSQRGSHDQFYNSDPCLPVFRMGEARFSIEDLAKFLITDDIPRRKFQQCSQHMFAIMQHSLLISMLYGTEKMSEQMKMESGREWALQLLTLVFTGMNLVLRYFVVQKWDSTLTILRSLVPIIDTPIRQTFTESYLQHMVSKNTLRLLNFGRRM